MQIISLDHFNLSAPSAVLEELRRFYCDVLGLTVGRRPPFGSDGYWLYAGDLALVHLSVADDGANAATDAQTILIGFPLTILAIFPFAGGLGSEHAEVLAIYSNPFNAIIAVLFLAVGFHHLMQGLQVVIEDYVHHKGVRTAALLGNQMFCAAFGFAGVFAVLKIAFTA